MWMTIMIRKMQFLLDSRAWMKYANCSIFMFFAFPGYPLAYKRAKELQEQWKCARTPFRRRYCWG